MTGRQPILGTLQAGRGIAAVAVVLHHALGITQLAIEPVPGPVNAALWLGYLGVDFFFVLSGFIILHAHRDDAMGVKAAVSYARKRLSRIYLPYIPASLGMIALYLFLHRYTAIEKNWSLLTSLTLFPTDKPPALAVAWTLVHEMLFYIIFLAFYFVRPFALVIAVWVAAIVWTMIYGIAFSAPPLQVLFAPINLEFVGGMLAAVAVRNLSPRWAPLFWIVGLAALASFFLQTDLVAKRAWFGLALAPLLVGLVWLEQAGRLRSPGWMIKLGDASYAIYLVHLPVMLAVGRGLARVPGLDNWATGLLLCIAFGVAGGFLYHLVYEKPAMALFKSGWRQKRPAAVT